MSYNRKTFRFLKLEKSCDFARRKNEVEDKMLDTKLKVMEKEERSIRQKLYEIRREKYSRSFYKSPERPTAKFVDINVCETEEGENKNNLITASGVERTKNSLRRRASVVEELCPGQVVRVCVSSKLEDKVARDENNSSSTLPPIGKAQKKPRRHSLAIVTDIGQHNMADLFTSVTSYLQSISEDINEENNISKDDLCLNSKTERKLSETALDGIVGRKAEQNNSIETCSEQLSNLSLETTFEEEPRKECSSNKKEISFNEEFSRSDDSKIQALGKTETVNNTSSPVLSSPKKVTRSPLPPSRPQSSRSYSDGSLQERASFRNCITPIPVSPRKRSRVRLVDRNSSSPFRPEAESKPYESAMGYKRRVRSLSAGSGQQETSLTEKEAKMAEQVIIRQLEIEEGAEKMRKLSMQRFGDSKNTLKVPPKQSSRDNSPTYTRRRLGSLTNEVSNNTEATQRPGKTRRHSDNPQSLKKNAKGQCKFEKGQTTMEEVLSRLSGDMPDCRYLRCDQNKHVD